MHAMLHYIKVHTCTMLAGGHATKVSIQRMHCIHALRVQYADAYMGHMQAWCIAP